jgi:branched-chain amino acid transport system substrate-binding protein
VPLLGGDSLFNPDFASKIGDSVNIYLTSPILNSDAYTDFLEEWLVRYGMPPASSAPAYAYDATQLLLMAIEDVAVVGQNGTLVIGRAALRERLVASDGLVGLTGLLRCNNSGECASSAYGVYEMATAVRSTIWPPPPTWQFE